LAEILAGKAGNHECGRSRKFLERPDVAVAGDVGKAGLQDGCRQRVVLAEKRRFVARTGESALKPANSGEEVRIPVIVNTQIGPS